MKSEFWTILGAKKTKKVIFWPLFWAPLALLCSQGRLETTWRGFQVAQAKSFDLRGLEAMSAQRFRRYGRFRQNFFCRPKVRIWLFQNDDVLPDFSIWGRGGSQGGSNHMKQLEMGGLWCLPCCLDQTSILKSHFDDIALCGISAGTDRAFFVPHKSPVWEASELWTCRTRQIDRLGLGDFRQLWNRSFGPF